MSPRLLRICRVIDRDTRALAMGALDAPGLPSAIYPRDYYRPAEQLWRWRGPGRFFWS